VTRAIAQPFSPAPKIIGIGPMIITTPKFVSVLEEKLAIMSRIMPEKMRLKPNRRSLRKNRLKSPAIIHYPILQHVIEKQESNH
jgi:hypothetical protein